MPIPKKLTAHFEEEKYYHVICKATNKQLLFLNDENKSFFLKRYKDLLGDFVDTYAYNLLDNHVHWLIMPKSFSVIHQHLNSLEKLTTTHKNFLQGDCLYHELIEQQFNRLFISYSLAFNKQYGRTGHLFNRPFKRIAVTDDAHFTQLCVYIHANSMHHDLAKDFTTYKWSSYSSILSDKPTTIKRHEVLNWFGGKEKFATLHKNLSAYYYNHELSGE